MKKFQVRFVSPSQLKPYYRNAKIHDRAQIKKLATLLKKFDFDQPIVVDSNYVIIKGHGRYLASIVLSKTLVPVIVRDDLTPEQVMASRIADNKMFDMGETDKVILESEMRAYEEEGGEGAKEFFDFLKPEKVTLTSSGGKSKQDYSPAQEQDLPSGEMLMCPKCTYTFWEQS